MSFSFFSFCFSLSSFASFLVLTSLSFCFFFPLSFRFFSSFFRFFSFSLVSFSRFSLLFLPIFLLFLFQSLSFRLTVFTPCPRTRTRTPHVLSLSQHFLAFSIDATSTISIASIVRPDNYRKKRERAATCTHPSVSARTPGGGGKDKVRATEHERQKAVKSSHEQSLGCSFPLTAPSHGTQKQSAPLNSVVFSYETRAPHAPRGARDEAGERKTK